MSPLAVITGVVVPVVGQLADRLEFPVIGKFSLQSEPKTADFLHRVVKRETVFVLPVDIPVHVAKEKLGILQALGFGFVVKLSKIFCLGMSIVEIFLHFRPVDLWGERKKNAGAGRREGLQRSYPKAG